MTWKNRIIGEGEEAPDQLLANPKNARRHPQNQQQALADVLNEVGVVQRVIVNQRTGYVVDGHARIALALRQGQPTIPVLYVDLDEREEALVLATLDPISAMATYDAAALDELLRDVNTGSAALQTMLDDLATEAGLYLPNDDGPPVDAEPQISRAEELRAKWGTEAGQLWKLGEHRLAVGDCTDAAVVERVMGGDKADMAWTDPPYGVQFQGSGGDAIEGDLTYTLIPLLFADLPGVLAPKAWVYVCGGMANVSLYTKMYERHLRATPRFVVWDKGAGVMRHNGYHSSFELVFYGFTSGAGALWFGSRAGEAAQDVWRISKPTTSERVHPTEKPVDLPARAIGNSCPPGGLVFEPFCGSGSGLIAAEQLGRRCRAVEIDPGYAAVTLQRWADATGGTPELIEG